MRTVEQASAALVPDLRDQINFFAEGDQRHFVDPITLSAIATGLVGVFATAVATECGKSIGAAIGDALVAGVKDVAGYVRDVMNHRHAVAASEVARAVAETRAALPRLPAPQILVVFAGVQSDMARQLSAVLPDSEAAAFAAQLRTQVEQVVGARNAGQ